MQKALTLSIIIPVYNEQDYLVKCLHSIKNQSEKPNEVIVVDNNSTDDSVRIAKKFDFVTVIQENNQGIVFARNAGFNASSCNILSRIDADTVLPVNWVKDVKKFVDDNPGYTFTGSGYFYNVPFRRLNSLVHEWVYYRFIRATVGQYFAFGSNMAITKDMWLGVKDSICLRNDIHEDMDISIHLKKIGYRIAYKRYPKVGVNMKRIQNEKISLWKYLMIWPRTLKVHNSRGWVASWCASVLIYMLRPLLVLSMKVTSLKKKIIHR